MLASMFLKILQSIRNNKNLSKISICKDIDRQQDSSVVSESDISQLPSFSNLTFLNISNMNLPSCITLRFLETIVQTIDSRESDSVTISLHIGGNKLDTPIIKLINQLCSKSNVIGMFQHILIVLRVRSWFSLHKRLFFDAVDVLDLSDSLFSNDVKDELITLFGSDSLIGNVNELTLARCTCENFSIASVLIESLKTISTIEQQETRINLTGICMSDAQEIDSLIKVVSQINASAVILDYAYADDKDNMSFAVLMANVLLAIRKSNANCNNKIKTLSIKGKIICDDGEYFQLRDELKQTTLDAIVLPKMYVSNLCSLELRYFLTLIFGHNRNNDLRMNQMLTSVAESSLQEVTLCDSLSIENYQSLQTSISKNIDTFCVRKFTTQDQISDVDKLDTSIENDLVINNISSVFACNQMKYLYSISSI